MQMSPAFQLAPEVKVMINIGCLLDIPTGQYLPGRHGEYILNGGLGGVSGVVGIGNQFKSTFMHYQMLAAASCIAETTETSMNTFDTEVNIHETHLARFTKLFPVFKKAFLEAANGIMGYVWTITDKTVYFGNEWYEVLKTWLKEKRKSATLRVTPFQIRGGGQLMIPTPTFGEIDSFTLFETENVAEMQDKHELGDSGANTMHMRQGAAKTRFLMEIPGLAMGAYHYLLMSAHIGKTIEMASGPMPAPPIKKLQHLKNGDTIKGVTEKFTFLMANLWHNTNATPMINQGTKTVEYPRNSNDDLNLDTDLCAVTVRQLRSKSGPSGMTIEVIISQQDGVLPSLTEFHYLKGNERFGISGTLQHFALDLLPEVKLSRTSVRSKIDENEKLRRALTITSEMCQMRELWHHWDDGRVCTPKELYDDLKAKGYDWDILLATRGWWTLDNDQHPIPFLSTYDLLRMKQGLYHPYWLEDDKKTIKKVAPYKAPKAAAVAA